MTHVVSARRTHTVETAANAQRHIHIVNPEWLLDCLYRTDRVLEADYPLPEADEPLTLPAGRQPGSLGARVLSILPAGTADGLGGGAARQEIEADGDDGSASAGDRVVAMAVERTGASDPRLAPRVAAVVQDGELPRSVALVDPRSRPHVREALRDAQPASAPDVSRFGFAPPHAVASSALAAGGAPTNASGSASAPHQRQPAAGMASDPRRARSGSQMMLPGPVAPLHILEERLDAELRRCVTPDHHAELARYLKVVRSSAETLASREQALSSLVRMLPDVKTIEKILNNLGFVRPSDRPLDTLGAD